MSEKYIIDEDTLVGIGDAIRSKKGMSGKIPLPNFKPLIESITSGGSGSIINGNVETYDCLEDIAIGDFVDKINNKNKQLISATNGSRYAASCVLLEENLVFIAHSYGSSRQLYGAIVEINGTDIRLVRTTALNTTSNCCYEAPSCVLLEENKVFIAYQYTSSKLLYGTIVTINPSNSYYISTTATVELNSDASSCMYPPSCTLVEPNKVFIAHSYGSSKYLYGTIVEIDGNTMTPTTAQLNSNANSSYYAPSCVSIGDNKVIIAHSYNRYLYVTRVTIDGTTMTAGIMSSSSTKNSCYLAPSCILLEPNIVFVAHSYSSSRHLYGTKFDFSQTAAKSSTYTIFTAENCCYAVPSCAVMNQNKVFIAYQYLADKCLRGIKVEVGETFETTHITFYKNVIDIEASCNTPPCCVPIGNDKVFIAHSYLADNMLYGTLYFGSKIQKTISISTNGVAKTGGTAGETIEVYVPNV